jgi:parvulin-like peptidyl-prolyl isomerase
MKNFFVIIIVALFSFNNVLANDKDIVAMVNGQPITQYQLNNRTKLIINTQNITFDSSAKRDEFDKQIINQLVEEELIKKAGQDFGIEIKDEMVNASIASLEKRNNLPKNYMLSILREHGLSVESYKDKITSDIIRGRIFSILASDIVVTETEARNVLLNSKGAKPKIHVRVFSLKNEKSSANALAKMENLRRSLMKSDLTKLSVKDKEVADVVELTDYSKLTPHNKSILQDTHQGSVSPIYKENDQYKLMVVLEKDFSDGKKVAAIKDNLKMQKAERKYNFFIKNLHSKADIVIK